MNKPPVLGEEQIEEVLKDYRGYLYGGVPELKYEGIFNLIRLISQAQYEPLIKDMHEALMITLNNLDNGFANKNLAIKIMISKVLAKAEGKE